MPTIPGYCAAQLSSMLTNIDSLILRIQQLQSDRKAIYITRIGSVPAVGKPNEFWFLAPDTVSAVYDTDINKNVEVTITGAGIHGEFTGEQPCHILWAGEHVADEGDYSSAVNDWQPVYFAEFGTHTIHFTEIPGHPLTAVSVIGMKTTKFDDDAEWMYETDADEGSRDVLQGSASAAGYMGLDHIIDYVHSGNTL